MKQEDKDLLLKDLCARSPYEVKIFVNDNVEILDGVHMLDKVAWYDGWCANDIEEVKPYLFPLSSMTEEQNKELNDKLIELELKALCGEIDHSEVAEFEIDFYNKHHIDFRGLIEKGLAIDATGLNIY